MHSRTIPARRIATARGFRSVPGFRTDLALAEPRAVGTAFPCETVLRLARTEERRCMVTSGSFRYCCNAREGRCCASREPGIHRASVIGDPGCGKKIPEGPHVRASLTDCDVLRPVPCHSPRLELAAEVLALRHQLNMRQRTTAKRPRI